MSNSNIFIFHVLVLASSDSKLKSIAKAARVQWLSHDVIGNEKLYSKCNCNGRACEQTISAMLKVIELTHQRLINSFLINFYLVHCCQIEWVDTARVKKMPHFVEQDCFGKIYSIKFS